MIIYFAFAGISIALAHLSRYVTAPAPDRAPTRWSLFGVMALALLVSFSGLRYYVGTDYSLYSALFAELHRGRWISQLVNSPQEYGYTAFSLLIKFGFDGSVHTLFWLTSMISIVPIYASLQKRSADPPFSIALYILFGFFLSPFNIIRQGMAMALSFWANTFISTNRRRFIVLNAIAVTLHTSAVIIIAIQMAVHRLRPSVRLVMMVSAVGITGAEVFTRSGIFASIAQFLNPRYEDYLAQAHSAGIGSYLIAASRLLLILYCLHLRRRAPAGPETCPDTGTDTDTDTDRYLVYAIVGLAFLLMGFESVVISRLELYFGLYLALAVANLTARRGGALGRAAVLMGGFAYFGMFVDHYAGLLPYRMYI